MAKNLSAILLLSRILESGVEGIITFPLAPFEALSRESLLKTITKAEGAII